MKRILVAIFLAAHCLVSSAGMSYWFNPGVNSKYSISVPTTGFSITVPDGVTYLLLNPAGLLLAGTVITPANPVDGQVLVIASTQAITGIVVTANTGQTVKNGNLGLTGGGGIRFLFTAAGSVWYRLY